MLCKVVASVTVIGAVFCSSVVVGVCRAGCSDDIPAVSVRTEMPHRSVVVDERMRKDRCSQAYY